MKVVALHWNPDDTKGKTRCGRRLETVALWTNRPSAADCRSCIRGWEFDQSKVAI